MATKKYTFLFTLADGTTHSIPIEIPMGEDGGYYLPKITMVSESEIEITFIPSADGMPSVDSVRLKLKDPGGNVVYDEVQALTDKQKAQARENIGAQPKGNYLESAALPEAINTALSQAKDSGMFDGKDGVDGKDGADGYTPQKNVDYFDGKDGRDGADGQPGKDGQDYVLTDADRNEIAEMAADLVEVPESSGGGIAVTGATVGQTVKISAVDENGKPTAWEPVNFPSGGGAYKLLAKAVTTEEVKKIEITQTDDGTPFENLNITEVVVFANGGFVDTSGYDYANVEINHAKPWPQNMNLGSNMGTKWSIFGTFLGDDTLHTTTVRRDGGYDNDIYLKRHNGAEFNNLKSINWNQSGGCVFAIGTTLVVYGR